MHASRWRVVVRSEWAVALLLAASLLGGCSSKQPQDKATAAGASPWLRGLLIMTPGHQVFHACGDTVMSWVEDRTGGELDFAFQQLGTGPERPIYVEVRAEKGTPPSTGPGSSYHHAIGVTQLRRTGFANEGGGCDEPRATWEFHARGNEPYWSVTVTRQIIVFAQPDDPSHLEFPYVPSQLEGTRRVYRTSIAAPVAHTLELSIEEKRCTDAMAGEIYPLAAEAKLDGKAMHGCASDGDLAPGFAAPGTSASVRGSAGGEASAGGTPTPAATPAPTAAPASGGTPQYAAILPQSQFMYMLQFVGRKPTDIGLWQSVPLSQRLYRMLRERFDLLLINMQEAQPIAEYDGAVYIIGNKMMRGATDAAVVVADTKRNVLYVWLKEDGVVQEYREDGKYIPIPPAVQAVISAPAASP